MSDDERESCAARERDRERERTNLKRTNIYCICKSEHVRRVWVGESERERGESVSSRGHGVECVRGEMSDGSLDALFYSDN